MAGFTLGLHRALFPWYRAGVAHLLYDAQTVAGLRALCRPVLSPARPGGGAPPPAVTAPVTRPAGIVPPAPRPAAPPAPPLPERTPPGLTAPRAARPEAAVPFPARSAAPSAPPLSARPVPPAGSSAVLSPAAMPAPEPTSGAKMTILPPEQWPPAWQALLARTQRAPQMVWTYPELADDLAGRSDPARGAALRKLVGDLGFPPGSHAFWPFALPVRGEAAGAARPDAVFFHSGIHALRPRLVVLLCAAEPGELGLPPLRAFLPRIHKGVRYVRLYGTARLMADIAEDKGRHERLVRFLRKLCGGVPDGSERGGV